MNTNKGKVLARGGWYSKKDCPDNPKQYKGTAPHYFKDVSRKPGKSKGEHFVTSQCKHCGGLVVDCPTFYL